MHTQPDGPRLTTATPETGSEQKSKILPPYNVILENDDFHTQDFVIDVLRKVLHCPVEAAFELMMTAHEEGEAVIWTGPKEVAELKADQVKSFSQTINGKNLGPLGCRIEPTA